MSISVAQSFYIDSSAVKGADSVTITSVDLYFKAKPLATGNKSGITNPGVSIFLLNTSGNAIPDANNVLETGGARVEYTAITASADASIPTTFTFATPCVANTDTSYAIAIAYDGNEDFDVWTCKEGDLLVGTNIVTAGATAKNVGNYYSYSVSANAWSPLNSTDLKFNLNIALYGANSSSTSLTATYLLPSDHLEMIMYDRYNYYTTNRTALNLGEMVYQDTPVIYGPISVNSANLTVTASGNVNFSTLIQASTTDLDAPASANPTVGTKSYIVLRNGTAAGANVNVREVVSVVSNTQITLDRLPTFTNNTASFSVTAAGKCQYIDYHWYTGRWWNGVTWDYFDGRKMDMIRLSDSNANSTVRFTNNNLISITINSGGVGYSNSDVITIYPTVTAQANNANFLEIGWLQYTANAVANVITNSVGTITGISITNAGYGLAAQTAMSIATANGSSANLTVNIGSVLRSETSGATFGNTNTFDMPIHITYPHAYIDTNKSTSYNMYQHYPYFIVPPLGHILQQASPAFVKEVDSFTNYSAADLISANTQQVNVLASRSNEVMKANAVIQLANGQIVNTQVQSSSILEISATSNNAFCLPMVTTDDVYSYTYIINNDVTGEMKGAGNALARHISTSITFAEGRSAEDVMVYIDAYRPAGTNIYVYTRLYNSADPDAFADKDWTLLTLQSNNATAYSSVTDTTDVKSFTYGLAGSNILTVNTISGSITTTIGSANVAGIGTNFTNDLAVNDVVKIYSSLFPSNYMITVVTAVSNSTLITVADPISNNSYAGSGFAMDFIGRPAASVDNEIGYPFQAFSDKTNDNIVAYYNSTMAKFSTYNTFQVKLVLTSNNNAIVPQIDDISAVGVSA